MECSLCYNQYVFLKNVNYESWLLKIYIYMTWKWYEPFHWILTSDNSPVIERRLLRGDTNASLTVTTGGLWNSLSTSSGNENLPHCMIYEQKFKHHVYWYQKYFHFSLIYRMLIDKVTDLYSVISSYINHCFHARSVDEHIITHTW